MSELDLSTLVRDFGDICGEARACRAQCALFDFSFMARGRVQGVGALSALAKLTPRRLGDLSRGRIRYALRLGTDGAVSADLTIWNLGDNRYEVMSGRRVDIIDLASFCAADSTFVDLSEDTAVFAVQGPRSLAAFAGLTDTTRLAQLTYFSHDIFPIAGVECRIGRLGYTGEKGFELILPRASAAELWRLLAGRVRPAGFAAADCLRIEAGFILFVNECRFGATAEELGLRKFAGVDSRKARVHLACFAAQTEENPVLWQPRRGATMPHTRGEISVTSACHSVHAGCTVGLGYVRADEAQIGSHATDPTGYFRSIRLVGYPLYDPQKRKVREPWPNHEVTRLARVAGR